MKSVYHMNAQSVLVVKLVVPMLMVQIKTALLTPKSKRILYSVRVCLLSFHRTWNDDDHKVDPGVNLRGANAQEDDSDNNKRIFRSDVRHASVASSFCC